MAKAINAIIPRILNLNRFLPSFLVLKFELISIKKAEFKKGKKERLQEDIEIPWSRLYGHLLIIPHTLPTGLEVRL